MNLIVTCDPESIVAAIDLERRTEATTTEGVFAEILAYTVARSGPYGPWIAQAKHEVDALRRHREAVAPRLRAIADGLGGEGEPARVYAAAILGRVDPPLGFRALLELLESDDPTTLFQALDELHAVVLTADEDRRGRADFVVEPNELARMTLLLDHPDEKVVRNAIWLMDELKVPGFHDHFLLPRMDDPAHGNSVRWLLAREGRTSILLDRVSTSLSTSDRAEVDGQALQLLDGFRRSDDPHNRPRALAMMKDLLKRDTLIPKERESIEMQLEWDAQGREALRPEHLAKAVSQVERLVAADIIDRASGDRAGAALRADEEGNHELSDYWGTVEALRARRSSTELTSRAADIRRPTTI